MSPEGRRARSVEADVTQVVPFFVVRDIGASVRFYEEGLGFTKTREWIDEGRLRWCWLQLGGAALMLQERRSQGHPHDTMDGPVGVGVSIYFMCGDAIACYRAFRRRGLEADRPFVGNGMWVTRLSDPDGYALFFESPTDEPEESVFPDTEPTGSG